MSELVIGTRGSRLALAQTALVVQALQARHPGLRPRVEVIRTEGDRLTQAPLPEVGGKGIFIKEIEEALLAGEVDLAVHSLKDVPTELPEGLTLGAVLEREDPRDALIWRGGLPEGARVGTSSPRRGSQLRAWRPDLRVLELRGNVETRLDKLDEGHFDAIVLAVAGLTRLRLARRIGERLSPQVLLPAVGQGALALELRLDDRETRRKVAPLDHWPTRASVEAERAFLQALGGGCRAPIAAYARVEEGDLVLEGMVATPDGGRLLRDGARGEPGRPEAVARRLVDRLMAQGALVILQEIRRGTSD